MKSGNVPPVDDASETVPFYTDTPTAQPNEDTETLLDSFFDHVYEVAKVKTPLEEQDEIKHCVENIVKQLLKEVTAIEPRFKFCDIVKTGSSYDGTKIDRADEFDFLAVIERYSFSESVYAHRECSMNPGFAHAFLKPLQCDKGWREVSRENKLVCVDAKGSVYSFRNQFRASFHQAILRFIKSNKVKYTSRAGTLILDDFAVSINGPECIVNATWISNENNEQYKIAIDVCPAVRCSNVINILKVHDAASPEIYENLKSSEHFYLIPRPHKPCIFCFKLVFPKSEQVLVKNLSDNQKKCLMILKYIGNEIIINKFCLKIVFNSFALKMSILHLSLVCGRNGHLSLSITESVMGVLHHLRKGLEADPPNLGSIFVVGHNIWRGLDKTNPENELLISLAKNTLDALVELFNTIKLKTNINESSCLEKLKQVCQK